MKWAAILALSVGLSWSAAAQGWTFLDRNASYPEGPMRAPGGGMLYTEMGADRVSLIRNGRKSVFWREAGCGPTGLAPYRGGVLVLCHIGARMIVLDAKGKRVGVIAPDYVARPTPRQQERLRLIGNPNDVTADTAGGVYYSNSGPFTKDAGARGQVVYLDAEGEVRSVAEPLFYPNGVFFDAARRRLLVSEHLARRIWAYEVLAPGKLGPAKLFADIDKLVETDSAYREAGPDGIDQAANGDIVVGLYGEGKLLQLTPDGQVRRTIAVPFQFVCMAGFDRDGSAIVVGAYDNEAPGLPGAVVRLPASAFAVR